MAEKVGVLGAWQGSGRSSGGGLRQAVLEASQLTAQTRLRLHIRVWLLYKEAAYLDVAFVCTLPALHKGATNMAQCM